MGCHATGTNLSKPCSSAILPRASSAHGQEVQLVSVKSSQTTPRLAAPAVAAISAAAKTKPSFISLLLSPEPWRLHYLTIPRQSQGKCAGAAGRPCKTESRPKGRLPYIQGGRVHRTPPGLPRGPAPLYPILTKTIIHHGAEKVKKKIWGRRPRALSGRSAGRPRPRRPAPGLPRLGGRP